MSKRVSEGSILITGSSRRLGKEFALSFAQPGYRLFIHYARDEGAAREVADLCRAQGARVDLIQADFTDQASLDRCVDLLEQEDLSLRALVHNVGPYCMAPLLDTTEEQLQGLFQSIVFAPFQLTRRLWPALKRGGGRVVFIGMAGVDRQRVDPKRAAYSMMKASQWHLMRSLAKELACQRVPVNMVSPGYLDCSVDFPDVFPPHSFGEPLPSSDLVRMVQYLVNEAPEQMTGQNLEIAGGIGL